MYTQNEKIVPIPIETEVKDAYLNYSMSVIVGRALPDVRDGLKPVHRRILYAMQELGLEHSKPYKKSARIVGECFIKDTLVLTSRGLVPIQDVERGEMVYTQAGLKTVTALYEMPARPLMRIELENGTVNTATRSQKFKVLTKNLSFEWKEACELTPQDYIVVKGDDAEIKQQALLGNLDGGRQVYCNENLAYLLGLFLSDGWIEKSSGRICFYSVDKAVIDRVRQILRREFEYAATIEARPYAYSTREGVVHHTGYQIRIHRRRVNKFLADAFCLHNADALSKKIPRVLFISPEPVVFAFVSGLVEGDGSIDSNRNVIHYGSVSQALISQLQILLQHHNIVSVQYAQDPVESHYFNGREIRNRNPLYCLEFRGTHAHRLGSRLNLAGRKAQKALDMLTRQQRDVWSSLDTIPHAGDVIFEYLSSRHLGSGWYLNKSGEKFRLGIKYPGGAKIRYSSDLRQKPLKLSQIVDWGILEKLRELDAPWTEFIDAVIEQKLYFMRVARVTEAPADITYDIQVADDHEFIANGMLVHNCLGKYHPHGDTAVYDTLVRMAQDFSLRYPLVEGQGNFGSVDGDSAAAMRYTEARLAAITDEMLNDLDKDTVNFGPNFDASLKEPLLLPAALPNLLVNGSSGIAVGMATNIPSHNLNEVADAIIYLLDNTDAEIKDLMKFIKGPDFATGGVICGKSGIKEAYTTGRGKVTVRGRASIEHQKNGKDMIVVTEIPYQVQKSAIIESAAALCDEKKIEGISDIRDESDKDGMRIVFELKRDVEPQIILNQLFKHTQLETTFGIINLALVENRPRVLNLKQILECYIGHRKVIIRRRTQFELDKALKRAHILEGLKIALKFIDRIIKVIKTSKTVPIAKENLMKEFGLSDLQAQAILEMQLQRLTALEQDKIEAEYLELLKKIEACRAILASEKKVEAIIKDELGELKKKYGDERRTDIVGEVEELEIEDLIADEDVVVTVSHNGYIKRLPVSAYRKQKRGGTGATGAEVKEEDFIEHLFVASTKDYLLVFTDQGQVHWLKVYEIPQASKQSKGKAVVNLLEIKPDSKISSTIPIREFSADKFLVMVTKLGQIKKTQLDAYSNPRKGGIIGITLDKGDELISVQLTDGKQELLIGTRQGKAVRFSETLVRDMGRSAKGVRGISLAKKDEVISMIIAEKDSTVLTVTELGFAKRTPVKEYRLTNRGGKGIINIKVTTKNGEAVGLKAVSDNDELMVITQNGIFLRCAIKDIRTTGRAAQGVRLIKLQDKDRVACIAPVIAEDSE